MHGIHGGNMHTETEGFENKNDDTSQSMSEENDDDDASQSSMESDIDPNDQLISSKEVDRLRAEVVWVEIGQRSLTHKPLAGLLRNLDITSDDTEDEEDEEDKEETEDETEDDGETGDENEDEDEDEENEESEESETENDTISPQGIVFLREMLKSMAGYNSKTSMPDAKHNGVSAQIITFDMRQNRPSRMQLDKTVLRDILSPIRDIEVAVICIAGPSRKGKSYIMNYLVQFLLNGGKNFSWIGDYSSTKPLEGFPFQNGTEKETVGINMWSEPFILARSDGSKVAVLLMDTQGVFDNQTREREWSAIVGLGLLTSSCLLYNIFTDLQEDVFLMLYTFMQCGLITMNDDEEKCFQKLVFLIRDWNNPGQYRYGPLGGKQFIKKALEPAPGMLKESIEVRQIFTQCFEEIDCFLFSPPGEKAKTLNFKGSNAELDSTFIDDVKNFVEELLNPDHIVSKKVAGSVIRGNDLFPFFDNYVQTFNKSTSQVSFRDAIVHGSCAALVEQCMEKYRIHMTEKMNGDVLFSHQNLENFHYKSLQLANETFDKQKVPGDGKCIIGYKNLLEANANKIFNEILLKHNTIKEDHASNWISETEKIFEISMTTALDTETFLLPNNFDSIVKSANKLAFDTFSSKASIQDETFFSEYLPKLMNKLKTLEDTFRTKNDFKFDKTRNECLASVDIGFEKFKAKFLELSSFHGSAYVDDDKMSRAYNLSREAGIKKYCQVVRNVDKQFAQTFVIVLEQKMVTEFENYVKINSDARTCSDENKLSVISCCVQNYVETISNKIKSRQILEFKQLNEEHDYAKKHARTQLKDKCKITIVQDLEDCETFLNAEITKAFEQAKILLAQQQTQEKQRIVEVIANKIQIYIKTFEEKLSKDSNIFSPRELDETHKNLSRVAVNNIEIPIYVTDVERQSYLTDLLNCLTKQFSAIQDQNEAKLQKSVNDITETCKNIELEYKNQFQNCDPLYITENDLKIIHEEYIKTAQPKFLSYINPFGNFVQDRFLQIFQNSISLAKNIILDSIKLKQQDNHKQVESLYKNSLKRYQSEIDCRIDSSQHKPEKAILAAHHLAIGSALNNFDDELNKQQIKSRNSENLKQQLETDIKNKLEQYITSNLSLLENINKQTKQSMESNFQNYKDEIRNILTTTKNENELINAHKNLKERIICTFMSGLIINGPTNLEELKKELTEKIELYFQVNVQQQFQISMKKHHDDISAELESAKKSYSNSMKFALDDNIIHEKGIIQTTHNNIMQTAVDNFSHVCNTKLMLNQNDVEIYQNELIDEIQILFKTFQNKEQNILEEFRSNADIFMDKIIQQYHHEMIVVDKIAKNINIYREKHGAIVENLTTKFLKNCNFPLLSLETEYKTSLYNKLDQILESYENNFKQSEIDPVQLGLEIDIAINDYKLKMDELLKDDGKKVDIMKLSHYHKQVSVLISEDMKRKNIRMTETVEITLKEALKQIFKRYVDENSLANVVEELAIGIDLGTTYSCVAVYTQKDGVQIIPNEFRDNTTPSYVRYTNDGEVDMVGKPAKNQAFENPTHTIFDAKRLIGRRFNEATVQEDIKLWPFQVVPCGKSNNIPQIQIGSKKYSPETISAEILKNQKKIAETFLSQKINRAVITVPAYFNDGQRQATKDAGKLAGLEILGIINEPTAAAIAYSLHHTDNQKRNVLVYDFGGGTFDVAILTIAGGKIEVIAVDGDTHLGGEDIDTNIMNYCVAEFNRTNQINLNENLDNLNHIEKEARSRRLRRIRHTCELRKIDLSGECRSVTVTLEAIHGLLDLHVDITREKFEEINKLLFEKTIEIVTRAIVSAKIDMDEIDDVVLVGGSTKIPKVQQLLQNLFLGKELKRTVHPDEAVARGAAIHAAVLNGNWDQKKKLISLVDVTPLSIGTDVIGDIFDIIIPKNTPLPICKTKQYCTTKANQTIVDVWIYEGENTVASKNHLLGNFELGRIPPGPSGKEIVNVTMKIDTNGILNVEAICVSNGRRAEINIEKSKGRLTIEELEELP